eukprot:GHVT01049913.1.p1 GENE.GHVT01049913.1~~GHVT01049913.1.p1  ORF type:complete len:179 (-),score=15.51 GHVT01049913.1:103-639(-)
MAGRIASVTVKCFRQRLFERPRNILKAAHNVAKTVAKDYPADCLYLLVVIFVPLRLAIAPPPLSAFVSPLLSPPLHFPLNNSNCMETKTVLFLWNANFKYACKAPLGHPSNYKIRLSRFTKGWAWLGAVTAATGGATLRLAATKNAGEEKLVFVAVVSTSTAVGLTLSSCSPCQMKAT